MIPPCAQRRTSRYHPAWTLTCYAAPSTGGTAGSRSSTRPSSPTAWSCSRRPPRPRSWTPFARRGAPAIGVAGAFGVVLGLGEGGPPRPGPDGLAAARADLERVAGMLAVARPTAVNLRWASAAAAAAGRAADAAAAPPRPGRGRDPEDRRLRAWPRPAGPSWPPATGCHPATPGGWPPPASAPPSGSSTPRRRPGSRSRCSPRPGRCSRGPAHRLGAGHRRHPGHRGRRHRRRRRHGRRPGRRRPGRLRPGGRQRRHRQQDRHPTPAPLADANRIPFYVVGPLSSFDPEAADGAAIEIEQRPPPRSHVAGAGLAPGGRRLEPGLRRHPGRHHRLRHRRRRPAPVRASTAAPSR